MTDAFSMGPGGRKAFDAMIGSPPLGQEMKARFEVLAATLWEQFRSHPDLKPVLDEGGRAGVAMCVKALNGNGQPEIFKVGKPSIHKVARYRQFATEKVFRLATHPEHRLSSESRDERVEHYAGAVRGKTYYVGTSGLWPDSLDELFSTAFLLAIGDLEATAAMPLLIRADNKYRGVLPTLDLWGLPLSVPAGS